MESVLYLADILTIFGDHNTTFASMNQHFNDKLSFFLAEVNFDISEGKQILYFQNGYFFKILW